MTAPLQTGDPAPAFALAGSAGDELSLASFAGQNLVLYFYPKDDTSGCTRQAIDFNAQRSAFAEAGTAILGVSPDGPQSHKAFKAKYHLEFSLGSDETKAMCEAYGVWVQKSMYGRKYMGVERTTYLIGKDGQIREIWRNVKVPGHAQAVLAAAQASAGS